MLRRVTIGVIASILPLVVMANGATAETFYNRANQTYLGVYADSPYDGAPVKLGFDPTSNPRANWGQRLGSYGYYLYVYENTNYSMEDHGYGGKGAKVDTWHMLNQSNEQWHTFDHGNGWFEIYSAYDTNYCVDDPGSSTKDVQVQIWTCNQTKAQEFQ